MERFVPIVPHYVLFPFPLLRRLLFFLPCPTVFSSPFVPPPVRFRGRRLYLLRGRAILAAVPANVAGGLLFASRTAS